MSSVDSTEQQKVTVFTDGSSRGNPGPGGWGAILIFPSDSDSKKGEWVVEMGGGEKKTTNNRMEMKAVIEALKHSIGKWSDKGVKPKPLMVYTDSSYLIKGITQWVGSWERSGWTKRGGGTVKNEDLWKELKRLTDKVDVTWNHVRGHTGVVGNERADEIACRFADGEEFPLKSCPYADYDINIMSLAGTSEPFSDESGKSKRSSREVYSYISSINGKTVSHGTWEECKERVNGVSGARFKKVYSPKEEAELMRDWSD